MFYVLKGSAVRIYKYCRIHPWRRNFTYGAGKMNESNLLATYRQPTANLLPLNESYFNFHSNFKCTSNFAGRHPDLSPTGVMMMFHDSITVSVASPGDKS